MVGAKPVTSRLQKTRHSHGELGTWAFTTSSGLRHGPGRWRYPAYFGFHTIGGRKKEETNVHRGNFFSTTAWHRRLICHDTAPFGPGIGTYLR